MYMELEKATKELLDKGELNLYGDKFSVLSIEKIKDEEDSHYKCTLNRNTTSTIYSHSKKAYNESNSIREALLHLKMMGYELYD